MLLGTMLMLAVAATPSAQLRDNQEHALIIVETQAEERFIAEALRFADGENLTPVTLNEINAFVGAERRKDLEQCDDVACYSEVAGALDIKHVVRITPTDAPKRAILTLYSLFPVPQQRKRKVVSGETQQEVLLRSIEDFRQKRQALADILKDIPCGFPWSKLRPVIGKPDFRQYYPESYEYFDLMVSVGEGKVVAVRSDFGSGPHMLECNRPKRSRERHKPFFDSDRGVGAFQKSLKKPIETKKQPTTNRLADKLDAFLEMMRNNSKEIKEQMDKTSRKAKVKRKRFPTVRTD